MRRLLDWLPLPLIFLSYQAAGWAGRRLARPSADTWLLEWDRRLFGADPGVWLALNLPRPALDFLDLYYFSYYVLVLAAPLVALRRNGRGGLWRFWTTAATSFLICDLLFPWFPSTPPRLLFPEFAYGGGPQAVNLWILDRFSIGGNVFPSSHVAAAVSFALCHRRFDRRRGWWFLAWAAGIAASTVSGGYHYGVDAAGGILVGIAADWMAERIYRRMPARTTGGNRAAGLPGHD